MQLRLFGCSEAMVQLSRIPTIVGKQYLDHCTKTRTASVAADKKLNDSDSCDIFSTYSPVPEMETRPVNRLQLFSHISCPLSALNKITTLSLTGR